MQSSINLTYVNLVNIMVDRNPGSKEALANLISALRGFLQASGLDESQVISSTLRASFYKNLAKHIAHLAKRGESKAYIANRKCYLGRWRSLLIELDHEAAVQSNAETPFQAALKEIMSHGFTKKGLANDCGISLASLKRWLNGATPNSKAIPSIRRLEKHFGLEENTLLDLACDIKTVISCTVGEPVEIPYRTRLRILCKEAYALKEAHPALREQWLALLEHKTEKIPTLERQKKGKWSKTRHAVHTASEKFWYCFVGHEYVATASIQWTHCAQYFGWLGLPSDTGGANFVADEIQSLALLCLPNYLHRFVSWKAKRADGIYHGGITTFLSVVKSLCHPKTGFITQSPHLADSIPLRFRPNNWQQFCEATFEWVKKTLEHINEPDIATENVSRNPFDPIQPLLESPNPMGYVVDMIGRMKAERPLTGGLLEAIWARDLLLVMLLSSNPLRAKNLSLMTYASDNSGNLYKRQDGSWFIRFQKSAFKNFAGAAKDRDYDMPVQRNIWPYIESYLKVYRPLLPHADSLSYVFLSSKKRTKGKAWSSLNRRVEILTGMYLWRCPGTGPHSFRHIMATAILKASPNDWQTAALILHDEVETVRSHYIHLQSSDGGERMFNILKSAFDKI